jgi:putative transposase
MTRQTILARDEFYHIYNRGTDKRKIFSSQKDYERFLALLYLCNNSETVHLSNHQGSTLPKLLSMPRGAPLVHLCAYCLMPNHFHLILQEIDDGGISRFMQKLITAYTMYFNKLHERSGALFQGRFKATHAKDDGYLTYLISYIHLNPVKLFEPTWKETGIKNRKGSETFLDNYEYSSYLDYVGNIRKEAVIIDKTALPDYFETPKGFKEYVTQWLEYNQSD